MNIELITRNYTNREGKECSYTVQKATVEVTLGGVTRSVRIERISDGHVWHSVDADVVVRFPTGRKEHVVSRSCIIQRGSKWIVSVQGFRNGNACTPVRWADETTVGSGWSHN